jgi:hypothetical protein
MPQSKLFGAIIVLLTFLLILSLGFSACANQTTVFKGSTSESTPAYNPTTTTTESKPTTSPTTMDTNTVTTSPPTITLSPSSGGAGSLFTIFGINFTAYGTVKAADILWGGLPCSGDTVVNINSAGGFTYPVQLSVDTIPGDYIVTVTDSSGKQASATFTVTAAETPASSPGWQLVSSVPTNNNLNGIWGSSSSNIFAIGDMGTILHYNGTSWSTMNSGTNNDIYGVWGSSSTDVFAVGASGTILHYNGTSWSTMQSNATDDIHCVWGSSSTDVYAVGDASVTHRYNGAKWENYVNVFKNNRGIWGSSATDVYIVGKEGYTHNDGKEWTFTFDNTYYLHGIWGSSGSSIFAVGEAGIIRHYDGTKWNNMESGVTDKILFSVWGVSSSSVYTIGSSGTILHYNGTSWSAIRGGTTKDLYSIWGSSSSDVWVVGASGTILHYTGG